MGMWLLNHAGINVNQCQEIGLMITSESQVMILQILHMQVGPIYEL